MNPQDQDEQLKDEPVRQILWETALGHRPWSAPLPNDRESKGILPTPAALSHARSSLPTSLPPQGHGYDGAKSHILNDIVPALNASTLSPNYYGFVTGGVTPAALLADHIVSTYDQNVQVHLPEHSVATDVEACALRLLLDLFHLRQDEWRYTALTTGATASNLLGLACGREYVLRSAAERAGAKVKSVGEHGYLTVMQEGGIDHLQVLSTMPHSSLSKVAGILGIGRANVKDLKSEAFRGGDGTDAVHPVQFDFEHLERELAVPGVASIVAVSCGEVNTGYFATAAGKTDFRRLRDLCDKYHAWLHVDGAFGIFSRILDDSNEFKLVKRGAEGIELADSVTGDAHKLLSVPYDCGFFFCRHVDMAGDVCKNPNAAYLSTGKGDASNGPAVPSPLNIGIENSRRFRALPVYATLLAYGRDGYRKVLERQVRLARKIAAWLFDHPKYNVLPCRTVEDAVQSTFMIVLIRAVDDELNKELAKRINATGKIFVSGTLWEGRPACRIAISNWQVDVERDFGIVRGVLESVVDN